MRSSGFSGTLPEFIAMLRADKRFYAPDLQTYIEKASEIGKRIDGLLPGWFGRLPRLTWTIRVKPPSSRPPRAVTISATREAPQARWSSAPTLIRAPCSVCRRGSFTRVYPAITCRSRSPRSAPTYRCSVAKTSPRHSSRAGRCTPNNSARTWACIETPMSASAGYPSTCGARAASRWTSAFIGRAGAATGRELPP